MPSGTVRWFDPSQGYGFIQPINGGPDVFVYIKAVQSAGRDTLHEGERVQYDLQPGGGKSAAENLRLS